MRSGAVKYTLRCSQTHSGSLLRERLCSQVCALKYPLRHTSHAVACCAKCNVNLATRAEWVRALGEKFGRKARAKLYICSARGIVQYGGGGNVSASPRISFLQRPPGWIITRSPISDVSFCSSWLRFGAAAERKLHIRI